MPLVPHVSIARRLCGEEDGVALPVAIAVLSVTLLLANVAMMDVLSAGDSANRDRRSKRAIQAADAGIDTAIWRRNHVAVTPTNPCISSSSGVLAAGPALAPSGGESWCPAVSEDLGTGASYSYRMRLVTTSYGDVVPDKVVSTGTVAGVVRRVSVDGTQIQEKLMPDGGIHAIATNGVLNPQNASQVTGSVRANGSVNMQGTATVCGAVTYGPPPATFSNTAGTSTCGNTPQQATESFAFIPLKVPLTSDPNVDNARICDPSLDPCVGGYSWNATTRQLSISGGTVTLTGDLYVLCSLTLSNGGRLVIAPTASRPTRIYIDSPERCGGSGGNFLFQHNATIASGAAGAALHLLVGGSDATATSIQFVNNATGSIEVPTAVYAPKSTVQLSNSASLTGGVAGRLVQIFNSAQLTYSSAIQDVTQPGPVAVATGSYRECTPTPSGASPASGC